MLEFVALDEVEELALGGELGYEVDLVQGAEIPVQFGEGGVVAV